MDFAPTDNQQTVRTLAAELLTDRCTPERLRAVEDSGDFDRTLWATLAEAGLLGVVVPEEHGGLGLGLVELAVLLEEAGKAAAPVPVLALALGATALVRHASAAQQAALLPGIAAGETLVTAALTEPLGDELSPATTARPHDGGWVLEGTKTCVPGGTYADHVLVTAGTTDGPRLFLVDPRGPGVTVERQETITWSPEALLLLDGAPAQLVGGEGAVADVVQVGQVAVCALLVGIADQAVRITAEYTRTREQFGHPIGHFQAVTQRLGDGFIDTTAMRLTTLQAVWRVAERLEADKEVAVAKFFASDGAQRVVRGAAHLHGGMGVSREYPLHRYYLAAKQLELTLGGGTRQLVRLGRLLADEPV
ncbi:MAG TPA: acyl-CoA dehydrogenase family protein [Mycobacteriales bacterium]|nr:acyl-CoA dehydrogenase family protein [Mycobacteriales bacterium]